MPLCNVVIVQSLSCVTLCGPMDCSMPDLPILHHLPELKLMSIESVMPSNHLILCFALILLPSTCPSIRVFSNVMQCYIYAFLDSTWSTTLRMQVSSFIDFFQEIELAHILSIHKLTRNLTETTFSFLRWGWRTSHWQRRKNCCPLFKCGNVTCVVKTVPIGLMRQAWEAQIRICSIVYVVLSVSFQSSLCI